MIQLQLYEINTTDFIVYADCIQFSTFSWSRILPHLNSNIELVFLFFGHSNANVPNVELRYRASEVNEKKKCVQLLKSILHVNSLFLTMMIYFGGINKEF